MFVTKPLHLHCQHFALFYQSHTILKRGILSIVMQISKLHCHWLKTAQQFCITLVWLVPGQWQLAGQFETDISLMLEKNTVVSFVL